MTIQIPSKALALATETDETVAPEQGDRTSFTVEGTVQSVSGDLATVTVDSVNGEPVPQEGAPMDEGAALKAELEMEDETRPGAMMMMG